MKCFNHHEIDAIGICRHCQKGVCANCLIIVGTSLSCKGSCEQEVASYNEMMERSKKVYNNLGKQWGPSAIISGGCGVVFLSIALIAPHNNLTWVLVIIGSIFCASFVSSIFQARRMGSKKKF